MKNTIDESLIKDITVAFYFHWHNAAGTNTVQGFNSWWEENKQRFIGKESEEWYEKITKPVYCKMWDTDFSKYEVGYVTDYTDDHPCDEAAGEYLFYDNTHSCWWLNAVPVSEGLKHHLDNLGIGSQWN